MSEAALTTAQVKYDEAMAMWATGDAQSLSMDEQMRQTLFEDKISDCLTMSKEALVSCRRAKDSKGKLRALSLVVKANLAVENSFDALMACKDELAMIQRAGDDKLAEVSTSELLVDAHFARGDHKGALEVIEAALPAAKASGAKEKEGALLMKMAELKIRFRKAGEGLGYAQDARKLYAELGLTDRITEADRLISWGYKEKGQVDKAPFRSAALEALKQLEEAASSQQRSAWEKAMADLNESCAFTEKEIRKIVDKAVEDNKAAATTFFNEVGIEVATKAVATTDADNFHVTDVPQSFTYMAFRFGGLGYGPRFRYTHQFKMTAGGSSKGEATADKQWYGGAVIEIKECADDWERELQYNPGIYDGGLQTGSAFGYIQ